MRRAEIILNEKDPFVREVWAEGYDYYYQDHPMDEMVLVNKIDKIVKRISMMSLAACISGCKIMSGEYREPKFPFKRTGIIHSWIKESDGSADRFRELIRIDV